MKRILVGVDESNESRAAAKYAAELAQAIGAELIIAAVVHMPMAFDSPELLSRMAGWREEEKARATRFVKEIAAAVARPGLAVETIVPSGLPAETLADLAVNRDTDMVVVGHRGRGAMSRMLVGSVADRLVQICLKPVLVVR
jgi:nucleotide-binding universal stress UspA family protein